jgi:hypothetical protein
MERLFLIITILFSLSAFAEERSLHGNVIQCELYPKLQKIEFFLAETDIKHPEEMRRVIPALMRLDLNSKIEAISLEFPKDWKESEGVSYEIRLSEYNHSLFSRQASCLVNYYKEGDRLFRFEQQPKGSYSEGYALFRNKELIAIVITGGIQI